MERTVTIVKIDSAGFRFGDNWIFRKYSLNVMSGEIVAILGPNGRGKTTLLKSICGLLKLREGRMQVHGEIGYVPQGTEAAFSYTVIDMVLMGRARHVRLFDVPNAHDIAVANDAITSLGIDHLKDRPFNRLSGGERQLVLIARALASECEILILDEPAAALDFHNQNVVLTTLREVSREHSLTVILTTHYPQHAEHLADKVLLMHTPEHYQFGASEEVMTEENLQVLYSLPIRAIGLDHDGRQIRTLVPIFS